MSDYKVYDGHNWIDPCWHHIYYRDNSKDLNGKQTDSSGNSLAKWILLDPYNRDLYYHDGTYGGIPSNSPNFPTWKPIKCVCYCDEANGFFYDTTLQRCTKRAYVSPTCEGQCDTPQPLVQPVLLNTLGSKGMIFWNTEPFYDVMYNGQGPIILDLNSLDTNTPYYAFSPNTNLMYYGGYKGVENKVWGGSGFLSGYNRLKKVGIWPQGRTMSALFKTTLTCPTAKTFIIGIGSKYGGKVERYDPVQQSSYTLFEMGGGYLGQYEYWHTFSISLPAGDNELWFWGYAGNNGLGDEIFGAEVYDISIEKFKTSFGIDDVGSLLTSEGELGLNNYIVWSTKNFLTTPTLLFPSYEPNQLTASTYECPVGYTFTSKYGFPTCEKIIKVECSDLKIIPPVPPVCLCPEGYIKNPTTGACESSTPALYDGTQVVIGRGAQNVGSYGQGSLLLYPPQVFDSSPLASNISQAGQTTLYSNTGSILNPITGVNSGAFFTVDLWRWRLRDCGIAQYKWLAWNRKKAYTVGTNVCAYNPTTQEFKKHTALTNISQNLVSPFNTEPYLDTARWTAGVTLTYATDVNLCTSCTNTSEFTYCLNIPTTKTYHVGLSGDNACYVELQKDSTGPFLDVASVTISTNFYNWYIIPMELPAGNHIMKLKGVDTGSQVSNGIEIYDMNKDNDPNIDPVLKFKEEFIFGPGTTVPNAAAHVGDTYDKLLPYVLFSTDLMVNRSIPIQNEIDPATGQAYVPYCAGGQEFDNCNGSPLCTVTTPCVSVEVEQIDKSTEINVWFDNSGSMTSSEGALQTMRDDVLKPCLIQLYENNNTLYNEKVKYFEMGLGNTEPYYERFVKCLGATRNYQRAVDTTTNLVINLVFQDESTPYGAPGAIGSAGTQAPPFNNTVITPTYSADITLLKNNLSTAFTQGYQIKGTLFQIKTTLNGFSFDDFRDLASATFGSTGVYTANSNLSSEFAQGFFNLDSEVPPAQTAVFYKNRVVQALNDLNITLTCP